MKPYTYPVFALFSSMQVSAQPQSKLPNVVILAKRINELAAKPDVEVEYYHSILRKHTVQTKFDINQVNSLPKVDILYGYANMNPVLPDAVVNDKAQGVVIAGVGNGNLYPTVEARVKDITRKGVIVVRSSCTGSGRVTLNSETDDAAPGTIVAGDLNTQKARILLQQALLKTKDPEKIQEMFFRY